MKSKDVLKLLKVTRPTLCKYVKEGKIRVKTNPNGQYDYNDSDVYKFAFKEYNRKNVLYARVSSSSQKKDLQNQLDVLRAFVNKNGITINDEYSDICSGLSLNRNGFQSMLDDIVDGKVQNVFVTYKDRLTRLSFDVFKSLFEKYGCKIVVLNDIDNAQQIEKEIFEEIITLLHCFSIKMYSNRRKEKLNLIAKELKLESEVQ